MSQSDSADAPAWRPAVQMLGALALVSLLAVVVIAAVPGVIGMEESLVVRSNSMAPAIDAGAVVFLTSAQPDALQTGDVITFEAAGGDALITHRIVEILGSDGERRFRTKGDANEEADSELVSSERIRGRVAFSIPMLGWLVAFAQSGAGLVLLVIVPAALLVAGELWNLHPETGNASGGGEWP